MPRASWAYVLLRSAALGRLLPPVVQAAVVAGTVDKPQRPLGRPRFLVSPGHESPAVERVITTTERFVIAEKLPGLGEIAQQTDPRA